VNIDTPNPGAGGLCYQVSLFGVFLGTGVSVFFLWGFTADDAFIVYRYARNCVAGEGLVFNPGDHVSALTSPLHALLCTLLELLPFSIVITNKLLSLALVAGACLWACRRLNYGPFLAFLFSGTVLASPLVIFWSVGGLETPYLLVLFVIAYCLLGSNEESPSRRTTCIASLICGICFLARHDSILFTGPMLVHGITRQLAHKRDAVLSAGLLVLPAILVAGSWLLFSLFYYKDILPTSYYSKGIEYSWYMSAANTVYIGQFLTLTGLPIIVGFHLCVFSLRKDTNYPNIIRSWLVRNWGPLVGLLFTCLYGLGMVTTHMMFSYRFLIPFLPILVFLAIDLFRRLPHGQVASAHSLLASGTVMCVLHGIVIVTLIKFSLNLGAIGEYRSLTLEQYQGFVQVLESQCDTIHSHWSRTQQRRKGIAGPDDRPTVYVYAAGVAGYRLAGFRIVDSSIISYRHYFRGGSSGVSRAADYLVVTSRHGRYETQLGGLLKNLEPLQGAEKWIDFDGRQESFNVYYNPAPSGLRLPDYVNGPSPSLSGPSSRQ
jgi:arabinofuranosyltransferase